MKNLKTIFFVFALMLVFSTQAYAGIKESKMFAEITTTQGVVKV